MARNKAPSENTIKILCGKAAGMCEFEGCNKRLFYDNVSHTEFNNAFVAHIIASSAEGPRGDAVLSAQLSDKLENLMLMCADHHRLIDQPTSGPRDYPVEKLKAMKKAHEEKIDHICSMFHVPKTEIVRFSSPIKGVTEVNIDYNLAAKAVLPSKQPDSPYGIDIAISSCKPYKSNEYWNECCDQMNLLFNTNLYNPYIQFHKASFSIFPIAPIPLIIKFGELIGDKLPCDVYQKIRHPDTWEWQTCELTNEFVFESTDMPGTENKVALVMSLTNDIQYERVPQFEAYKKIYKIKAVSTNVDCIKSSCDLSAFWHLYQQVMDAILNTYGGNCCVDLFPAIPVSAAFEVGRRYMPNTYPTIAIFEEDNGFFETLKIGGKRN